MPSEKGIDWAAVNAELAVELFGWRRENEAEAMGGHRYWREPDETRAYSLGDWAGTWDGMGEVIEAMMKRGAYWTSDQSTQSGARFRVGFGIDDDEDNFPEWFDGEADTLPQAVAVAALRAVAPERARELGL